MNSSLIAKCSFCGSIFNESYIEHSCPFCSTTLSYKQVLDNQEKENLKNYFGMNIPKLNHPYDFIFPNPITTKVNKPREIWNTHKNFKYHFLDIIPIYKYVNGKQILFKLCFTWDHNFENIYGIFENVNKINNYYFDSINLENIAFDSEDLYYNIYTIYTEKECYEKFVNLLREGNNFNNLSNYFQLYNSINWNILEDDIDSVRKTFYEYASINYLFHLLQMIKVKNISFDFDDKLLSIDSIEKIPFINIIEKEVLLNKLVEQIKNLKELKKTALNENYSELIDLHDYEDVFDYYSTLEEGAVAPVSVPLSVAAQRSTEVYNKLYDLGYRPSMNIYSRGEITSLCPTFELNEEIYFIECNNNVMHGINIFNSMDEMKSVLEEVYNENNTESMFITIKNIPSDVMTFNLKSSKDNKDFLTRLLDIKDTRFEKRNFNYEYDVSDEYADETSILNKYREVELNSNTLFKYMHTNFKLRNISWSGQNKGYVYVDKNDNVIAFIISELLQRDSKVQTYFDFSKDLIHEICNVEVCSDLRNTDFDLEMIKRMNKRFDIDTIRTNNIQLKDKLDIDPLFKKLPSESLYTSIYKFKKVDSLNESIILNEALNPTKRKKIEDLIYNVFNRLDTTGANTKKYKDLFKSMNDTKFNSWLNEFLRNPKKNFYLEVLPNKNAPRIKNCIEALDYLKVPAEEYVYYRHDGHKDDPIRTRYKVPVLYVNLRRVQQILSKKNTYSLDINKRNLKTGQVTGEDKIAYRIWVI